MKVLVHVGSLKDLPDVAGGDTVHKWQVKVQWDKRGHSEADHHHSRAHHAKSRIIEAADVPTFDEALEISGDVGKHCPEITIEVWLHR
jgi:hypothetical protein